MAARHYEPDEQLNHDIARRTGDLIEQSKQLLADIDRELATSPPPGDANDRWDADADAA